jgi:hypothetical protein
VAGFRYALVLESAEPAGPAVFATIIPTWHVGDTFLAGADLARFRIVAIQPEMGRTRRFTRSGRSSRSSPVRRPLTSCDRADDPQTVDEIPNWSATAVCESPFAMSSTTSPLRCFFAWPLAQRRDRSSSAAIRLPTT